MCGLNPPIAQPSVGFENLATELQIDILSQTDLVTPYKRVGWGETGFYLCAPNDVQRPERLSLQYYFTASRAVRQVAIQVFYSSNEFVVEEAVPTGLAMSPAATFLNTIVPRQALSAIEVLSIGVRLNDPDWRRVVDDVAPSMESLRTLTVVAKYDMDNNIYKFGDLQTLNQLCRLVEEKVWPKALVGEKCQQLVVHFHSGAGSWLAGRDPRFEPTYFLEHKDLPKESSC
ncbi:hypothetical protein PG991_014312 [Apiospora marii]|uniref:Uncharacterized protein n=1 Tax=Apiospora marii TaxID=335849 RepID=A0ABR1R8F5_9PEZI